MVSLLIIDKLLEKWKKRLKPDYTILIHVDRFVHNLNLVIKEMDMDATCMKGGSIAKDTFLKNDHDVDIFVRFDMKYADKDISSMLEDVLKKMKLKFSRIHGSRDYFQLKNKGLNFELVPVIKVHATNYMDARNVTDLSPEHVLWVQKYTNKNPGLADEIRLAKQFCKANGVYGAESYINGFSGHILDILTIHFGNFKNMIYYFGNLDIQRISKDTPIIIDHEKNLTNPLKQLNKSKISPLIIVDPIQKDRNAAAALSKEKLITFIKSCKNFINDPKDVSFVIEKISLDDVWKNKIKELKKDSSKKFSVILLKIKTLDSSKDIMGTKVLKLYEDIVQHSTMNGFEILSSHWAFQFEKKYAKICLIYSADKLSEFMEHQGPPLSSKDANEKFQAVHKNDKIFIKNNRVYALIKRKFILPKDFLHNLLEQSFIKTRISSIKIDKIINK